MHRKKWRSPRRVGVAGMAPQKWKRRTGMSMKGSEAGREDLSGPPALMDVFRLCNNNLWLFPQILCTSLAIPQVISLLDRSSFSSLKWNSMAPSVNFFHYKSLLICMPSPWYPKNVWCSAMSVWLMLVLFFSVVTWIPWDHRSVLLILVFSQQLAHGKTGLSGMWVFRAVFVCFNSVPFKIHGNVK